MTFGNGQSDFYRDSVDAVAQSVWTRLKLWAGEWFIDTADGTPYQQAALGVGKAATIGPAIRSRIIDTPGVTGLSDFSLVIDADTRQASIRATISSQYGTAPVQGVI
jgi:hypothetical protein